MFTGLVSPEPVEVAPVLPVPPDPVLPVPPEPVFPPIFVESVMLKEPVAFEPVSALRLSAVKLVPLVS